MVSPSSPDRGSEVGGCELSIRTKSSPVLYLAGLTFGMTWLTSLMATRWLPQLQESCQTRSLGVKEDMFPLGFS
jgi:hypothetical protein